MAIGFGGTVSVAQVNSDLGQLAVRLRSLADDIRAFDKGITDLGGHDGLVDLGFTGNSGQADGEAQDVLNALAALMKPAEVYFGTDTQASMHNYDTDLEPVRGFRVR